MVQSNVTVPLERGGMETQCKGPELSFMLVFWSAQQKTNPVIVGHFQKKISFVCVLLICCIRGKKS